MCWVVWFSLQRNGYFKLVCIPWDGVTMNFMPNLPDALNKLLKLYLYIFTHAGNYKSFVFI